MEDRFLVEALRSRDPIAMGAVYDDYAERLYDHCWFQLRNVDAAQVAFRDTLMCAEAHVGRLRTPSRFGAWLYALARIECRRRWPAGPVQPDLPVARHDQDDVDLRLMAWRAVTALSPLSRELLDLRHRRGLNGADIALVVGLRAREIDDLLAQAGVLLEAALIAEILAHDGLEACARRAALLRPRKNEIDADLREALVRHSLECAPCARHLPENIAPGKVYALLPQAPLPKALRGQIMNCFTDPELAGYRLFAATRVSRFGAHGFPLQPRTGRTPASRRAADDHRVARSWSRAVTAAAGAVIAAVTATTLCRYFGQEASHDSHGVVAAPPGARSPRPSPAPAGHPGATRPVSAALPLGPPVVAGPVVALGATPEKDLLRAPGAEDLDVSPDHLSLSPGGVGTVTLSSPNGSIQWSASGAWPLRLSPDRGALQPGTVQTVTVRAPLSGPGSAVITFWPGGEQVEVTWIGPPPPPPSRSPTPPPSSPPSSPPGSASPTPTATMPTPTPPSSAAPPTPSTTPSPAPPTRSAPPTPPKDPPGERPSAFSPGAG